MGSLISSGMYDIAYQEIRHVSRFVIFSYVLAPADFTHIYHYSITDTGGNKSYRYRNNSDVMASDGFTLHRWKLH